MKKSLKNLLLIALAVILIFALWACNPVVPPDNGQNPGDGQTEPEPEPEEPEPEPEDLRAKDYAYTPTISETMPRISISTASGSNYFATYPDRETKLNEVIEYEEAYISVSNCESKYEMSSAKAQVKARGNYTLNYEKKPLRIKFDKKTTMLGLNGDAKLKSWVLLAEWKDLSALNNATAFYFGKTILGSDGYYCSDYRHVEVYLNGYYWGVYLLAEQQEVDENRVNIYEAPDDYAGTDIGYLMEYDGYYSDEKPELGGDPTFTMNYSFGQKGYTLKNDIYSSAQVNFIKSYMNNLYKIAYDAVYSKRYYKFNSTYSGLISAEYADAKEAVASVIDIESLVNMYILQEISCDPDIGWSSFYMDVDMSENGSKKLVFEAPWDYDSAFGIRAGFMNSAVGMYASRCDNPWLVLLAGQSWFTDMVKIKWQELVKYDILKNSVSYIAQYSDTYEQYFIENFTRWENRVLYGNGELTDELNSYRDKRTAQKNASLCLERWLTTRLDYLNDVFGDGTPLFVPETGVDETIPEGAVAYRFEAENAALTGGIALRSGNGASGNGYLGNVSGQAGKTITFTVNASSAASVYLYIGLSKRSMDAYISSWFSVKVNNQTLSLPKRIIPSISGAEEDWHAWTGIKIMRINLIKGINTIVLTTAAADTTNVDYIDLYSAATLSST